jgi:CHAT domain-containing protein
LRLCADLVTLSGCATGANVAAAGDELLGITRGLFCAGATTLVLSLWNVHDESTTQFMTSFYGRIAAGTSPAIALRETMQELRAAYPHPYYWAPFVVTGKSGQGTADVKTGSIFSASARPSLNEQRCGDD